MGARLEPDDGRFAPFTVHGERLLAVDHDLDVASAQVKSCLLMAALTADGTTTVAEPSRSRDHTERMLLRAGVDIVARGQPRARGERRRAGARIGLGARRPQLGGVPRRRRACSCPGSRLLLADVGVNWTRTGFLRIVRRMRGIVLGDLEEESDEIAAVEPTSDLDVAHGALEGTVVEPDEVPLAIDELPLVALLGCFAEGADGGDAARRSCA